MKLFLTVITPFTSSTSEITLYLNDLPDVGVMFDVAKGIAGESLALDAFMATYSHEASNPFEVKAQIKEFIEGKGEITFTGKHPCIGNFMYSIHRENVYEFNRLCLCPNAITRIKKHDGYLYKLGETVIAFSSIPRDTQLVYNDYISHLKENSFNYLNLNEIYYYGKLTGQLSESDEFTIASSKYKLNKNDKFTYFIDCDSRDMVMNQYSRPNPDNVVPYMFRGDHDDIESAMEYFSTHLSFGLKRIFDTDKIVDLFKQ
tara:strand:- start:126834 stop:127610 length:777 start_codon:yes stop_codon:yes gene_type:complete